PKMEEEPSFPLTSEPEEEALSLPPFEEIERLIEPPLIPLPAEGAEPGGGGGPLPEEAVLVAKGPSTGGPEVEVAKGGGRIPWASGQGGGAGGGRSGGGGKPLPPKPKPKPAKAQKNTPKVTQRPSPPPSAPPSSLHRPAPQPKRKPAPVRPKSPPPKKKRKEEKKEPPPKPPPPSRKPKSGKEEPPPPKPEPKPKPKSKPALKPEPKKEKEPPPKPDPKELRAFQRLIKSRIEKAKRYPEEARLAGAEGRTTVSFVVGPEGVPSSIKVVKSSGSPLLDRAAVETVKRAAPFLPYPKSLRGKPIRVKVSISFRLR
ncbi:MAG TPA: energy transducer TonB, partial [Armatimonadetes bacterium]|nr:energy transducer TonB [Armatimonadota bacterium]